MAIEIEQRAFVLHRRPYRETSVLLTLFTPDYGKINAVVKGVRSQSKQAQAKQAWLQPFQQLSISWVEKNTQKPPGLVNLRQLEPTQVRFPLYGDLNLCGLYINELLYRLLYPQVAVESLYSSYQQTLYDLAATSHRSEQAWVLRQFEYGLLMSMGLAFSLDVDVHQTPIQPHLTYWFFPEVGTIEASEVALEMHSQGVEISGQCLLKFAQLEYDEACLTVWKQLFRKLLARYLGDKPIQSRALFV